ncbi:MAG TPA: carboxypeptidase-like regulatory domain-containing protein, partial [Thermoanaerobaculia bacterium]
ARIYLYRLGDGGFDRAVTDEAGSFLFAALPAGLYKVIVHKAGFVPAVVRLTRASAEARQFLDLELVAEPEVESTSREDFWSVRSEIPPDVLRDI